MDFIVINSSPRKNMNTSQLVNECVDELKKKGKSVKVYNLYDLQFKGCYSCFACKKVGKASYGKCIIKDDLNPIFDEIRNSKGIILATPIYYRDVAGELRCFVERLLFQHMLYTNPPKSIFGKRIPVGMIYTMNVMEEQYPNYSLKIQIEAMESSLKLVIGDVKSFFAFGTNQLTNYEGIEYTYFDSEERLKRYQDVFPREKERVRNFVKELI
jgi:multimeric flavodoxin WrbA